MLNALVGVRKEEEKEEPCNSHPTSLVGVLFLPCFTVTAKELQREGREDNGWSFASGKRVELGGIKSNFLATTAGKTLNVVIGHTLLIDSVL